MRHAPITRNQLITMENIEKYYASASLIQLKKLCNELDELELSSIPVLQKELIKRGEMDLALSITEKLTQITKNNIENKPVTHTKEEIHNYIQTLYNEGFTFEQIVENLKSNGIDIDNNSEFEKFNEEFKMNSYLSLKSEGFSDEEIKEKIKTLDDFDLINLEKTKEELISKANSRMNWGKIILLFSGFIFLIILFSDNSNFLFLPLGKLFFGYYLYSSGKDSLNKLT